MKKIHGTLALFAALLITTAGFAQEAPAPNRSPRMPVNRQILANRKDAAPPSRTVTGTATILDGEKLRVQDVDLRLFGIVPPQLSASFGPQARAALDNLASGQFVTCQIRDRDHDGRFLATCQNAGHSDLALELLRRGLAVTARGSLSGTDQAAPYLAAEQAAAAQKAGLWSLASSVPSVESVKTEASKETAKEMPKELPAKALVKNDPVVVVSPAPVLLTDSSKNKVEPPVVAGIGISTPPTLTMNEKKQNTDEVSADDAGPGFLARYQLLVTGVVMLVTALSIFAVLSIQRWLERRDEMKALAAALRGELMAARTVCQARLKAIATEADDKAMAWPRFRATLYQAYVGRLGWLGAELSRQIASIYGLSSDYAAYYNTADETRLGLAPKKQALQTLAEHIEDVLPRLALIEQVGMKPSGKSALTTMKLPAMPDMLPPPGLPVPKEKSSAGETDTEMKAKNAMATDKPEEPPTPSPMAAKPEIHPPVRADAQTSEAAVSPTALWDAVRKFTRDHWAEKKKPESDDMMPDYQALIEEEMLSYAFSDADEEPASGSLNEPARKTAGKGS